MYVTFVIDQAILPVTGPALLLIVCSMLSLTALLVAHADCQNPVPAFNSLQNLMVPPPLMRQEVGL